jgi:hypothetical protein
MTNYINQTGYWLSDVPQEQHAHSIELSAWIVYYLSSYKDKQIFDFGCGNGNYLKDLKNARFQHLLGVEGDPIPNDQVEIIKADLTSPLYLGKKGVVICLEVGEHIPQEHEQALLDNINKHCEDVLIMSWAIRGQGGYGHVNELNNDEVIPKIEALGFTYIPEASNEARSLINNNCPWFKNTILIFTKPTNE